MTTRRSFNLMTASATAAFAAPARRPLDPLPPGMMLLVEVATVFLFLAVLGVPGWDDVRWVAIAVLV